MSNDAFLEVVISWFVKRLGYLVDESRPVKLATHGPASDIDLICMYPGEGHPFKVGFLKKQLSHRLLIESKGWLDYPVKACLREDLKAMKGRAIPKYTKKDYTFVILKEEIFEKGIEIFGTHDFERVIVVPNMIGAAKDLQKLKKLKNNYRAKGVVIIEIQEILKDLFKYISDVDEKNIKNKSELTEDKAQLRHDLVLGVFNLIYKYKKDIRGTLDGKNEG